MNTLGERDERRSTSSRGTRVLGSLSIVGIVFLSAAVARYRLTLIRAWERWLIAHAALPNIAPDVETTLIGLAMASPVVVSQLFKARTIMVPRPA